MAPDTIDRFAVLVPSLRSLPLEVRLKIYHLALEWNGKTPGLLAALRPDRMLYLEALEVFVKQNTFTLSTKNLLTMCRMKLSAFQSIRKLSLDMENW